MRRIGWIAVMMSSLYAQWDDTLLHKGAELYDETREKTIQIYRQTLQTLTHEKLTPQEERKRHLEEAWERTLDDLKEGAKLLDEYDRVPDSAWIGRDKKAVQEDFDTLLARIVKALTHETLQNYRYELKALQERIAANRKRIAAYREKRIAAPQESAFATTKAEYSAKIAALEENNTVLRKEVELLKQRLQKRFEAVGVTLDKAQIDVLLTRVDGDDIIGMALAVDTIGYITEQIAHLMKESGESLDEAKRYYGMYQVLQELTVYIQQAYIDKCDTRYIPNIDKIIAEAKAMIDETARLKAREEDPARRNVYKRNLATLKQTLRVARRYRIDLLRARNKVAEAKKEAEKNLAAAQNTYKTVMLSSDLYKLIEQSQKELVRIGKIQVPEIVPFQNLHIQKAYGELTRKIK